ncbi:MAG: hypothetical protein KA712_01130 [Myxococcales bacterium]|nr:hypothetical protein [Myxococcales bacterium]
MIPPRARDINRGRNGGRTHIHAGKVIRVRRSIYRVVHFPAGEHEELVAAWLWAELAGVVSH